ncbi:MAG: acetylxylan esterase [Pirellulaceae bacterium]
MRIASPGTVRRRVCVVLGFVLSCAPLQAAEPAFQLKVVTDRADALYEVGETARFVITVTHAGAPVEEGSVSYVVDDLIGPISVNGNELQGELPLKGGTASVSATADRPGFLRCRASYKTDEKTMQALAGAGFSPLKIEPSLPVPDDFDAFWTEQKRQLAELPMEAQRTPVPQADPAVECFDVQIPCTGGAPVSGYLGLPKDAKAGTLPAILWVHGAGVRSSSLGNAVKGAEAGMLSMDINAHGIPNGKPAKFYQELTAGRLRNYRQAGRESRDTVYFRGMFLRLARAIDYLASRPEWDGRILAVTGHSQGGGQTLVAGGLDERVTIIAAGVPAICDHTGRAAGRISGWPKLVPQGEDGKPDPVSLQVSRYVDAVNFAARCRADAIMSVGFIDAVCPPSSCYAAYNQLQGEKRIINEPLMGHAAPAPIQEAFFKFILERVEEQKKGEPYIFSREVGRIGK